MLVGLIAVGVDRLTPKAGATDMAAAGGSDLLIKHDAPTPATPVSRTNTFNHRLTSAVAADKPVRGAFELGSAWAIAAQQSAATADTTVDDFTNAHRLTATLGHGDHAGAVIDGKLAIVGQSIDGFKLISVAGRTATFSNGHTKIVLNQIRG